MSLLDKYLLAIVLLSVAGNLIQGAGLFYAWLRHEKVIVAFYQKRAEEQARRPTL